MWQVVAHQKLDQSFNARCFASIPHQSGLWWEGFVLWHKPSRKSRNLLESLRQWTLSHIGGPAIVGLSPWETVHCAQRIRKHSCENAVSLPVAERMRRPPVFHSWPPQIHRRSAHNRFI
jgi:hypothetical protein